MPIPMETDPALPFGPQTILPVQFHPRAALSPEKRLMLAVLDDAVETYRRYGGDRGGSHRRLAEATQWLFSDDTSWPFSSVNVCHALGIDIAGLRGRLRPPPTTAVREASASIAAAS
jgi:hypothetical protein